MQFHDAVATYLINNTELSADQKYSSLSYHLSFCLDRKTEAFKYDILTADLSFSRAGFRKEVLECLQEAAKHGSTCHENTCLMMIVEYFIFELLRSRGLTHSGKLKQRENATEIAGGRGFFTALSMKILPSAAEKSPISSTSSSTSTATRPSPTPQTAVTKEITKEVNVEASLAALEKLRLDMSNRICNISESGKNRQPRLDWRPECLWTAIVKVVADQKAINERSKFSLTSLMRSRSKETTKPIISVDIYAPFVQSQGQMPDLDLDVSPDVPPDSDDEVSV
jgi:hypothetical protein